MSFRTLKRKEKTLKTRSRRKRTVMTAYLLNCKQQYSDWIPEISRFWRKTEALITLKRRFVSRILALQALKRNWPKRATRQKNPEER